ncbi:RHS repeat-associated core domain-containing protein [Kamptonema cortianum]|nr:RHS repeat-associated core domain-containing protein [Kamptonema cortianum]
MNQTSSAGVKNYMRDGVGVTSPVLTEGNSTFTASGERTGGVAKTLHSGLKNDDLQTNSTGTVIGERLYDAFGNVVSNSGTWSSHSGYGGKFGYQDDTDSGLKLLGHRYYDSSTGRFLTRDPIKDGRNWYGYCENAPVRRFDPDGLMMLEMPAPQVGRDHPNYKQASTPLTVDDLLVPPGPPGYKTLYKDVKNVMNMWRIKVWGILS